MAVKISKQVKQLISNHGLTISYSNDYRVVFEFQCLNPNYKDAQTITRALVAQFKDGGFECCGELLESRNFQTVIPISRSRSPEEMSRKAILEYVGGGFRKTNAEILEVRKDLAISVRPKSGSNMDGFEQAAKRAVRTLLSHTID